MLTVCSLPLVSIRRQVKVSMPISELLRISLKTWSARALPSYTRRSPSMEMRMPMVMSAPEPFVLEHTSNSTCPSPQKAL